MVQEKFFYQSPPEKQLVQLFQHCISVLSQLSGELKRLQNLIREFLDAQKKKSRFWNEKKTPRGAAKGRARYHDAAD